MKWYVKVKLEAEYDDIEAEDVDEAFEIASNYAMAGGEWYYTVASIEEEENE